MKFLEIAGSYNKGKEWDNIRDTKTRNGLVHDMRILPVPFIDDATYDGTYSEHFIEHLTREEGINFFEEMFRILKPNGTLRVIWPSMNFIDRINNRDKSTEGFVDMYTKFILNDHYPLDRPYYNKMRNEISKMNKFQKVAYRLLHQEGEHKCLWYKEDLIQVLENIGFSGVKEELYQKSRLSNFNGIDNKQSMRPIESTVVECTR